MNRAGPLFLLSALLCAGQTTGIVEGTIVDAASGALSGAAVTVVETLTKATRTMVSSDAGRYSAGGLPPGVYRIEVEFRGFRKAVRDDVQLSAGRSVRADFRLELGERQDMVNVIAVTPLVGTSAADWGGTVDQTQLAALPLNGRDMFDLVAQQPGVYMVNNNEGAIFNGLGIQASVNGNRPNQNSFRMDGLYVNDAAGSAPASAAGRLLGVEGIRELRLITNPFSAEYGKAASAVFTAVSKSGSNAWHGSLYHYLRNSATDARNFFDPAGEKTPPLRRNQFGGLLSGPLAANRVFFLVNYEGVVESRSRSQRATTLTDNAKRGLLPSGQVAVNPLVAPFLALYPSPNGLDFGDGTGEFISAAHTRTNEHYGVIRGDFLLNDRLRTSLRYSADDARNSRPDAFLLRNLVSNSRFTFLQSDTQLVKSAATLHNFRFGLSRVLNNEDGTVNAPETLTFVAGRPVGNIEAPGLTPLSDNNVAALPRRHFLRNFQANYDISHTRGRHTLRAGAGFDRTSFDQLGDFQANGRYRFNSLTDLLRGTSAGGDLMSPDSDTKRRWSYEQFYFFVQDDVKIRPNLSLLFGVRYEGYTVPREADNKIATLRNPLTDTALTVGGPLFDNPSSTNFAPRAAVAWDLTGSGKTVVRAGAGVFFDLLASRELTIAGMRVPPFYRRLFLTSPAFPDLLAASKEATADSSIDGLGYYLQQPYVLQFRFAIEHQLDSRTALEVSFARSRGVHLLGQFSDINIAQAQTLADGSLFFPAGAPLRNPSLGRIGLRTTDFDSSSNALNVRVQRRMATGLNVQGSYTWGKALDNSSSVAQTDFDNSDRMPTPYNIRLQRGPADFDVRQTFNANVVWQVAGRFQGWRRNAFGGWEFSGLVQAQTGFPFNPRVGYDRARHRSGFGDLDQRPSLAPGAAGIIQGSPEQYFNPAAFTLPEAGFYGNLGRNVLTGPGLFAANVGVQKSLWHTERQDLRLRVEGFNVTNRPNLDGPSELRLFTSTGGRVGAAGRITTTSTPARQIQFALRWAF